MNKVRTLSLMACLFLCGNAVLTNASGRLLDAARAQKETQQDRNKQAYEMLKRQTGYTDAQMIEEIQSGIDQILIVLNDCKSFGQLSAETKKRIKDESLKNNPDLTPEQLSDMHKELAKTCQNVTPIGEEAVKTMQDFLAYLKSRQ